MSSSRPTTVSVIVTVKNEERSIGDLLQGLLAQSRVPDEIVVVDGGSTDATAAIVEQYAREHSLVHLVHAPGSNISQGRNLAIAHARGPIIASTDAGSRADSDWLQEITRPFDEQAGVTVVGGFFRVETHSVFEACVAALTGFPPEGTDPDTWFPSSRSIAFLKSAWADVGGYPEWLDYGEDTRFVMALRREGHHVVNAPRAWVSWSPRPAWRAFLRQYFRYARGDGQALTNVAGYGRRLAVYAATVASILAGIRFTPWFLLGLAVWGIYRWPKLLRIWRRVPGLDAWLLAIPLVTCYDAAATGGFLFGLLKRLVARVRPRPSGQFPDGVDGA